jgi:hypothetical protein
LSSATSADTVYTEGTFYRNRPFHTLIQTYRQGSWKLVLDRFRDVKELYDLDADPGEARDLFAERPEIVAELYTGLRHRYHKSLSRFMGVRAAASAPVAGDPAKERELRALGYLGGGGGGDLLEFFPLRPRAPGRYGPFGDEPELDEFQARIDFTRGRLAGDQIVAGYADEVGRRDARGVWFDRRAIFLLRGRRLGLPARVEVYVDTTGPRPSRIEAWIEGEIVSTFAIDMGGSLSFDVPLPARIAAADDWRLELRADTRFVSRTGASPRTDEHASFRVRRIYATGTNPTEGDL